MIAPARRLPAVALQWSAPQRRAATIAFLVMFGVFSANHLWRLYIQGPVLHWAQDILVFVVVPAGVGVWLWMRGGLRPRQYGIRNLNAEDWGREAGLALLGLVALYPLVLFGRVEGDIWFGGTAHAGLPSVIGTLTGKLWLDALYLAASAALVEEAVFRILPLFAISPTNARRKAVYVIGTAVCYALIHSEYGPAAMVGALYFGLGAGVLALRCRTIWPVVFVHFLFTLGRVF